MAAAIVASPITAAAVISEGACCALGKRGECGADVTKSLASPTSVVIVVISKGY